VLGHDRRNLLWFEVTRHPTAQWLARQITEAFPWASAPASIAPHRANQTHFAMAIRAKSVDRGCPWPSPGT